MPHAAGCPNRLVAHPVARAAVRLLCLVLPVLLFLLAGSGSRVRPGRAEPFAPADQKPQDAPDPLVDVVHLRGDLRIDFDQHQVSGTSTLTLRARAEDVRSVRLDAGEMDIRAVTVDGKESRFDYDNRRLTIPLADPLSASHDTRVIVEYTCRPRTGMYFIEPNEQATGGLPAMWTQGEDELNHYWIPCWDYPNEFATSEMVVTVPAGMSVISNGRLLERSGAGAGQATFHWKQDVPHASYLMSLVAGRYESVPDQAGSVRLEYNVPPSRVLDARTFYPGTAKQMRFFEKRLGVPYAWAKYASSTVEEFTAGAMENISATTFASATLPLVSQAGDRKMAFESLMAHELAHQWYGDLLTCKDWSHVWLNEGFATYMQACWFEDEYGKDEFAHDMYRKAMDYQGDTQRYHRPTVTDRYADPGDMFDSHSYPRGAWILHMLRAELGEDTFWNGMTRYTRDNAHRTVETADFRLAMERTSGRNLVPFFRQWTDSPGFPKLKVAYAWETRTNEAVVTLEQTQTGDGIPQVFEAKVDLLFRGSFGTRREPIRLSARKQEFRVRLDAPPTGFAFDPDEGLLKSVEYEMPFDLRKNAMREGSVVERARMAGELGRNATPAAVDELSRAAREDAFWGVRAAAARSLGKVGSTRARDALTSVLEDKDPRVRAAGAEALGAFVKDEAAAQALAASAGGDGSFRVRQAALRAIGKTRLSAVARPALESALAVDSPGEEVRIGALEGLASLGDPSVQPLLESWTTPDRPWLARRAGYLALAEYASLHDDAASVDRLIELSSTWSNDAVRSRLVDALGNTGDRRAVPALEAMRAREPDATGRRRVDKALAKISSGRSPKLDQLQAELDELKREVRALKDRAARR